MNDDPAVLYRRIFGISRPVNVHFLGVWASLGLLFFGFIADGQDTVSSLGELLTLFPLAQIPDCNRWRQPSPYAFLSFPILRPF